MSKHYKSEILRKLWECQLQLFFFFFFLLTETWGNLLCLDPIILKSGHWLISSTIPLLGRQMRVEQITSQNCLVFAAPAPSAVAGLLVRNRPSPDCP
ncbi:hypothetical protein BO82DRAFT_30565 [Aspergillus uvarum CBS 121591]|uniref:Uncharacterized protein n=1 Tax=Aspergillus uvarum CBS 121591 TaxID=1448315 RepID=A0A319CLQ9_9EURO|nr:hypothetical protein BO82DRAFT_30565 [Aspergillus uvarum CBS 121591]PYH84017.1 hypothetical protein BO82DRAFT_30565 [Aspergillus uvarum CBS 121591]